MGQPPCFSEEGKEMVQIQVAGACCHLSFQRVLGGTLPLTDMEDRYPLTAELSWTLNWQSRSKDGKIVHCVVRCFVLGRTQVQPRVALH